MKKKIKTAILNAAVMTFEELGLVFTNVEVEEKNKLPMKLVKINFQGPLDGCLVLSITENLLPVLTANMLGQEEIPSKHQQNDALGELANVICGNVLPKITDSKKIFKIHAPVRIMNYKRIDKENNLLGEAELGLEDGTAKIMLYVNSEIK